MHDFMPVAYNFSLAVVLQEVLQPFACLATTGEKSRNNLALNLNRPPLPKHR
jgi:hypothetical protein